MTEPFPRKLYGRRKGPKLSAHKEDLVRTLLPTLALTIEKDADPRSYFSPPPCGEVGAHGAPGGGLTIEDVWLEIGFGAGEHLLAQARINPAVGLIGAEPYEAGVAKLLTHFTEAPVGNIRLYQGDARDILEALPDASLGRIFLLFPDPWPKTRHHKRRFLQMDTLDRFARVLRPGGELRVASDDAGYVDWTLERVQAHPSFVWTAQRPSDWKARPASWPQTRYEAKALHGPPAYLSFLRS